MSSIGLTINPGPHIRAHAPLEIPFPAGLSGEIFSLTPGGILAQNVAGKLCLIVNRLAAKESANLTISPAEQPSSGLTVTEENDTLTIKEGDKLITQYHFGEKSAYPIPSKPYFYPLNLEGLCLTREITPKEKPEPKIDHPHHRSLWVALGNINGTDIWSDESGHGFQRHISFSRIVSGPVCAGFQEKLQWESAKGEPLLAETRTFRAWRSIGGGRLLDLMVSLKAAFGPVKIGDTKEGGICSIRVREPLQGDQSGLMTNASGGVTETECWGHRASWIDYSGTLEGSKVGIAILDHPSSFRYPTHWHTRDYGLCTANPFGHHDYRSGWSLDGSHEMKAGDDITFRYRIYLHEGDCESAQVGAHWLNFAFPPTAAAGT